MSTGATYPLTPLQQGMLLHALAAPGSGVDHLQIVCELSETIHRRRFEAAWRRVCRRHPVLRTRFRWRRVPEPVQVVEPRAELPFHHLDLSALAAGEQESLLARFMATDRRRGFALDRAPLLRLALWRLGAGRYRAIWSFHHSILDGRSVARVLSEVFHCYEAAAAGQAPRLAAAAPFAGHVRWLAAQDLSSSRAFWRRRLAGITAPTPFPPPTPGGEPVPATTTRRLPAEVTAGLAGVAERHRLTLGTLVHAAWALLLSRYSGEETVVYGANRACRHTSPGAETVVGPMLNTVPLRVDAGGGQRLLPWLRRLRRQWIALRRHELTPLVAAHRWSRVPPELPLFETLLVFAGSSLERTLRARGGAWAHRRFHIHRQAGYPLAAHVSLAATPGGDALEISLGHDRRRCDGVEARRMLAHLGNLLRAMAVETEDGDRSPRLDNLPHWTPAEAHQLRREWNDTARLLPAEATLHRLFAARARQAPEAVALVAQAEHLSYGELAHRARRWAARLQGLGVGLETVVGIPGRRSPQVVTALVAILESGGAYLPLDPESPRRRLGAMLEDAGATLVLADRELGRRLPAGSWRVLPLEVPEAATGDEGNAPEKGSPSAAEASPEQLACVLYTSGSTGRPKGVCVPHRGVVRLVVQPRYASLGPAEVFFQLAPLAFDASNLEIWGCLLNGGRLVLAPPETPSLEALGHLLCRHGVTTLWLTAGLFHLMVERRLGDLTGVRQLLAGGEALDASHVGQVVAGLPGCRLINGYGPTEDSTLSCCHTFRQAPPPGRPVPIGRPIDTTRAHVLSRRLTPVPTGAAGELCIAGGGLARGYAGRAALTAERFVPDPFAADSDTAGPGAASGPGCGPGGRLYRTGDRVRRRPDGTLEMLGRLDRQLKVRGFRIEPGEIEGALGRHPSVRQAVVELAPVAGGGPARLTAYVVADPAAADGDALRSFLARSLPSYMVPAAFVFLDELPLTANRKVDRRALPAPEAPAPATPWQAPASVVEEVLAACWGRLLGAQRVGRHESFFALGGHSLLALQVCSRVADLLGVELAPRQVLEHPTVAALARRIEEAMGAAAGAEEEAPPPMRAQSRGERWEGRGEIPLSHAQERLWFLARLHPGSPAPNIAAGVHLTGALEPAVLEAALAVVQSRHQALRSTFPSSRGRPRQEVAAAAALPLARVDLTGLPAAAIPAVSRRLAEAELVRPFDLATGPLLRTTLLHRGPREWDLLLTLHHMVVDGWSLGILYRELGAAYLALAAGRRPPLAPPPLQYPDYALWQRRRLGPEVVARLLAAWRRATGDGIEALDLPTDRPRPPVPSHRGTALPVELPPYLVGSLHRRSTAWDASLYMTLLAALAALLHRIGGQGRPLLGSPVAHRGRRELEGLVGCCVNLVLLPVDLGGDPGFQDLVERVRRRALAAHDTAELPFEALVAELAPERQAGQSPLLSVTFSLEPEPYGQLALPGIAARPLDLRRRPVRFDLELHLRQTAGGLGGMAIFASDLFDATTIHRLLGHFRRLLEAALERPEAPVSTLPLLTAAEEQQLAREWNDTLGADLGERSLYDLFAAQAARASEAVAVEMGGAEEGGEQLTYGELARRARALAGQLAALGVGPEVRVALCLDPSPELVTAMLAISLAGGAWVPLESSTPPERLVWMLEASRPAALLTRAALLPRLPTPRPPTFRLGAHGLPGVAAAAPRREWGGLQAAYVLFTSGSTGRPKGVVVPQRAVVSHMLALARELPMGPGDRMLAKAPAGFDVAVWELWAPLLAGARLVVAPAAERRDPAALLRTVVHHGVTALQAVPPLLALLLERPAFAAASRLSWVVASGERLGEEVRRRFEAAGPPATLLNAYGPAEATITSTVARLGRGDGRPAATIGRPLADVAVHVMDRRLRPLPQGVPGELAIGGVGLARGYLEAPALTAERFVPAPVGTGGVESESGARLYRSGDRARHLADGSVEFLGRLDRQVQIRGVRVEPAEVEAALGRLPAVGQAVVAVREDGGGPPRLVAYVVRRPSHGAGGNGEGDGPKPLGAVGLRRALAPTLPPAMVPDAFVFLPALPLTPHGKVDHRALPPPAPEPARGTAVAAANALEERLARIWCRTLDRREVGVEESFFDAGGHSLLLARLQSQLEEDLGLAVPMADLFRHPTIRSLAEHLSDGNGAGGRSTGGRKPLARGTEAPGAERRARGHALAAQRGARRRHRRQHPEPPHD